MAREKVTGWIKLQRKIMEHKAYFAEEFTRMSAWIDMLLLTNHQEGQFYVRNNLITVKRGQLGWAANSLAKRWHWSRGKVTRYLNYLEKQGQIIQHKSKVLTIISIVNYDLYQSDNTTDNTTKRSTKRKQGIQLIDTNKNDKHDNNDNNEENDKNIHSLPPMGDFQAPSLEDVISYFIENGYKEEVARKAFNYYTASNWHDKNGKPIKNWKQTMIATWFKPEDKIQDKGYRKDPTLW